MFGQERIFHLISKFPKTALSSLIEARRDRSFCVTYRNGKQRCAGPCNTVVLSCLWKIQTLIEWSKSCIKIIWISLQSQTMKIRKIEAAFAQFLLCFSLTLQYHPNTINPAVCIIMKGQSSKNLRTVWEQTQIFMYIGTRWSFLLLQIISQRLLTNHIGLGWFFFPSSLVISFSFVCR